ncbi:alpha-ribazole phosphatase [Formosa sp. L2A11]|uniref:alpha-ribazole phosphatase n=1 Tax=Formosa sp. L2A11 TaxID=2686363 RepID=UPI00131A8A1E|nr:alpha-ribazole phosphatase [Formosa sp. L2A11]
MEIYLIRHTTPDIERGICYGQSDMPLKDTFPLEAKHILESIPKQFDKVYSSPLQRCTQLAVLIDKNYITDNRLKELDFGSWELKKWSDIPNADIQPWYNDWVNTPADKGESYQELQNRAVSFINTIPNHYNKIAIVTHSGVIRSLWAYFNTIDLKNSFNVLSIEYGAVLKIKYSKI